MKDLNKKITAISYNSLYLPELLTIDGVTHKYTYAADGRKLKVVQGSTNRDYVGNIIYENGSLKKILVEGGYIEGGTYYFYFNDHLGNVRTVIDGGNHNIQFNHYYPYGLPMAETSDGKQNEQPYKYNGKEFERKNGLNWMDYGARYYDATLGRFTTMDRFAEKYYSMSPYQYGANNPVGNIDINGDSIVIRPNANGLVDQIKQFLGVETTYQETVKADLAQLKKDDKKVGRIISDLEDSENIHYVTMPKKGDDNSTEYDPEKVKKKISQGSIIYYDPYRRRRSRTENETRTPRVGLSHELQHSFDLDRKLATYEKTENGIKIMEVRAVNTENRIRKRTGDPKRVEYGKKRISEEWLE